MKLCIADPPYLGRAEMFYGARRVAPMNQGGNIGPVRKADVHPDAAEWDDPATHRDLVDRLVATYDGWAIAMLPDNLRAYLQWVPSSTRVAVWHDPNVMPTGAHPRRRWEAVLVSVPAGRRRVTDLHGRTWVGDVLTVSHGHPDGFAGRKPPSWTRWVLSMLGYEQDDDTVDDLFAGTGAVAAEVNQRTLNL